MQEVYCIDDKEAMIAQGIYVWMETHTERIGSSIVVRFRAPELTYDELVEMDQNIELVRFPYELKAQILDRFYVKYWSLAKNQVFEKLSKYILDDNFKKYNFIFIGHGGGAVLATFAALVCKYHWRKRFITLITYGAPRMGNNFFVELMQLQFQVKRITVGNDYVPLFFADQLTHNSDEIWIPENNGCNCFDPNGNEIPEIYECSTLEPIEENKECNLQFQKPRGQRPDSATTAHLGRYFGKLMSSKGCNGG
ncbi:hypothetical protein G9A89_010736 [Geosiphon pyriformis]|nr:hypothetical protein G9A89_010736 [Geosiphon pyriformis]